MGGVVLLLCCEILYAGLVLLLGWVLIESLSSSQSM